MELLPAWMKGTTPEMDKKAEKELGESPERRSEALKELRMLIKKEPGFQPLVEEEFLIRFLRARKYDVKRAFNTLKNYYSLKSRYSGIITDFTPQDLKLVLEMDRVFVSPKRARDGEGILISFLGSLDTDVCTIEQHMAACLIGIEVGMETEGSQICGSHCVIDMKGITLSKLKHFCHPSVITFVARFAQDVVPCRINGVHFVNEPFYFGATYNVVKPFFSKKLKERMHFHSTDLESLHKYLPPETLPEELGGYLRKKDFQDFRTMMLQNNALLDRINTYVFEGKKSSNQSNNSCSKLDLNTNVTTRSLFNVSPP